MKGNRIIGVRIPPHFLIGVKDRSRHMRTLITRVALNDFNEAAYKKAKSLPSCDYFTTSIVLNGVGVRGLDAYKEKHGLSSRMQAVLAVLATHHAKQSVVEKKPMPKFYEAFAMVGARG